MWAEVHALHSETSPVGSAVEILKWSPLIPWVAAGAPQAASRGGSPLLTWVGSTPFSQVSVVARLSLESVGLVKLRLPAPWNPDRRCLLGTRFLLLVVDAP